jgi:CheY-like chemotaxis protein
MSYKLKVLVVDDEQIVLDSINKHLRNDEDIELEFCPTGIAASALIETNKYDIIFTDLMMPEVDGIQLLEKIKKINPNTIVIIITGYATIDTSLKAMQMGALDYLAKPFTKDELKKIARRAIGIAKAFNLDDNNNDFTYNGIKAKTSFVKGIGDGSWFKIEENGCVMIGIERSYLLSIGSNIQSTYLPTKGDELHQGNVYFQIFSTDLKTQSLMSPLSGIVTEVNEKILSDASLILQDPFGQGWLIKLSPTNFEEDLAMMGL